MRPPADARWPARAYAEAMFAVRGFLARDAAFAVVFAVLLPVITLVAARHYVEAGTRQPDALAAALAVAAALPLAFRRRYPATVMAVVFGITVVYFAIGYPNGPMWLPLVCALYTCAAYGHRTAAITAGLATAGTIPWLGYLFRYAPLPSLGTFGRDIPWMLAVLGAGEVVRAARERAATAARGRAEEARSRATQERLRIARELHDSLGHYLSMISVQSAVALNLNDDLPEQARAALTAVKDASREGLRELRSALDVLRADDGEPGPRAPTLTLARLDDLVARTNAAGLRVRAQTEGEPRQLPFGVDVAAYRIVQEALTNVARHAGAASADVTVTYQEGDVTVQVDDDGTKPAGPLSRTGSGIAGMRDRVAALGGELYAGPRPGGGFRVRARLPLGSAS
jgi:signal transduction histidine kinase